MAKNTIIVSVLADTKQLASGFEESTSVLGRVSSLGKGILKTTVGLGAAVAGLALGGGFARAMRLDEARTQLDALGYSGEQVQGIMDSALTSVKGTAFGLDAAATIAANALASGIQPGEQLTASLTTVANTAALAKTDMGDMGAIFQKVWANGKVTTMEMNQLADRGVPIWQYLSKTFGVSNAELRKMIEGGKVTADMFMNSLGPAVDGMATRMSSGFKGMASNALAALSRVGAMFAGPLLDSAKGFLGEATTLTDGLGERLQPVAARWAAFLGMFSSAGMAAAVLGFLDRMTGGISAVAQFIATFSPLLILVRELAPILPQLSGSAALLGQAFAEGVVAVGPSLVTILGLVLTLAAQVIPPVASLTSWVLTAAAGVVTWVVANREWISALGVAAGVIAGVVAAVSAFKAVQLGIVAVTYGAQGAMLVAGTAAKVYGAGMAVANTATRIAAAGQWLWNAAMTANPIGIVVTAIAALVAGLVWFFTQTELGQTIWGEFTRFLGEAWANIATGFTWLWETVLSPIFSAIGTGITWLYSNVIAPVIEGIKLYVLIWAAIFTWLWQNALSPVFSAIGTGATWLWSHAIKPAVDFIIAAAQAWGAIFQWLWQSVLSPTFNAIGSAARWLYENGVRPAVEGIANAIDWAGSVIAGIRERITSALVAVGSWLVGAGKNLVQGFWNGISNMAGWLRDQVMGFFGGVVDWAKGVLGIHSPSRVFKQIGGYVGQGLADGLERTESLVANAAASLGDAVIDGFDATLDGGQVSLSVDGEQSRGGAVYNIVVQALTPTPEIGRVVVDAIRSYEAAGGRG